MNTALEPRELHIRHLGRVPYAEGLALQERLRDDHLAGKGADTVLLLEHPDVITFGRASSPTNAPSDAALHASGYTVYRVNRGGDVTYHGPGQLVGYPILDLEPRGRDVHVYLRTLERVLIDTLADFGIAARSREGYTGVWLDQRRKVASIGVGLRRWITMHGFALNVSCDLSRFSPIVACGLRGVEMTSMERLVGPLEAAAVVERVEDHLRKAFA
jgi:lipoyl(octanoyl) transferase